MRLKWKPRLLLPLKLRQKTPQKARQNTAAAQSVDMMRAGATTDTALSVVTNVEVDTAPVVSAAPVEVDTAPVASAAPVEVDTAPVVSVDLVPLMAATVVTAKKETTHAVEARTKGERQDVAMAPATVLLVTEDLADVV